MIYTLYSMLDSTISTLSLIPGPLDSSRIPSLGGSRLIEGSNLSLSHTAYESTSSTSSVSVIFDIRTKTKL